VVHMGCTYGTSLARLAARCESSAVSGTKRVIKDVTKNPSFKNGPKAFLMLGREDYKGKNQKAPFKAPQ
jgi:hypothetical protein